MKNLTFVLTFALMACAHQPAPVNPVPVAEPLQAVARLMPLGKGGKGVQGTVLLAQQGADLNLKVSLKGLAPKAKQAFHVHEFGDCTAPDGMSAGGHFNPHQKPHGGPHGAERHEGDLGNLQGDEKGAVEAVLVVTGADIKDWLGRSLVVHIKEDDLKSQPAGAAGERVACGVIGLKKPGN